MKILPLGTNGFILDESKLIKETRYEKQPDTVEFDKDGKETRTQQQPKRVVVYADGVIDITNEEYHGLLANTHCFTDDLKAVRSLTQSELFQQNEQKKSHQEKQLICSKITALKQQLVPLKEKLEQDAWGEVVPDIGSIKNEAIRIHTEMRRLEGKPPRVLKI